MKQILLVLTLFTFAAITHGNASPGIQKLSLVSDPVYGYFMSGGVEYTVHKDPFSNTVTEVSWSGGTTGMGDFGDCYTTHGTPSLLAVDVSFTGSGGAPVNYNNVVYQ